MATKPKTRSPRRPAAADLSPEVAWYCESRGYDLTGVALPLIRTPEPRNVKGAIFDPAKVDKAILALRALRHTQGKWAGRPLEPMAWQVAYVLAPVFGWVHPDDDGVRLVRIIRECYVEVPRKNGKTTIWAGVAMILAFADGEQGAQVMLAAAGRDQAMAAFKPIAAVAKNSKKLRAAGVRALAREIVQDSTSSVIKTASSRGDLAHGANIHGGLVDELHVHKSPDVLEAIESGVGSRSQPLVATITTADDGKTDSVYAERRGLIEKIANKTFKAPAVYGVIFAAPETADRFSEATFAMANPSYPVTPTRAFAKAAMDKAQSSPIQLASYERLHLGIRSKRDKRYIDLTRWDRNKGSRVDPVQLIGRAAFGGLDLGSTSDLTALSWLFPRETGGFDLLCHFWMPEAALERLDARTQRNASAWVKDGWIELTPGDVTDYDFIQAQIEIDLENYQVAAIGYDPWNATQLSNNLAGQGAPMVQVRQGFVSMNSPMKELLRLVLKGTTVNPLLRHGGNPVLRWMVDNLRAAEDPAGNVKPDKAKSMDKIDGVSAMVTGLATAMQVEPEQPSKYEQADGLVVI